MHFEKCQLEWKIVTHFTRSKQRAALRELFIPYSPNIPPNKILLRLWNKYFLGSYSEIYRHLLSNWFENAVFSVRKWCSWIFFSDTKQKHVYWKSWKVKKVFWLCFRGILFSMSNELRFVKWVRFFERNCIVKWMIFFASFYCLWDFLLEHLE